MATKKERLEAKRAVQAAARAEKAKKAANSADAKDGAADLAGEIDQVNKEIADIVRKAKRFIKEQEELRWVPNDRHHIGEYLLDYHFAGAGSMAANEEFKKKFREPLQRAKTRRENLLNKQEPGRAQRKHEEKEEEKAKVRFWTMLAAADKRAEQVALSSPRDAGLRRSERAEVGRGLRMAGALVEGDRVGFETAARPDGFTLGLADKVEDHKDVEIIERRSVGWVLLAGKAPFVRCYHRRGTECLPCDCEHDGATRESATKHELSERALKLLAAGKLEVRDGLAHAQRALAAAAGGDDGVVANPFGFAGSVLRNSVYGV
ncbi:MAG: hypothetical protein KGL39_13035 [Patescibacteria group bacterium]|nr:hypothetical protein [Patescibacteria group bacterium]